MEERKVRVLISFALEPELVQQIEDVDPRIATQVLGQDARRLFRGQSKYPSELEAQTARREFEEAMSEAEVLFGFWGPGLIEMYPTPQALREAAPRLRWLQLTSAGLDRAARSGLLESDLMVTSASGLHATPIGEYVLCLMLMFCKGAHRFVRAQDRGEWIRYMPQELYGKTVGVVGLGHIGAEVARLSKAFGCRVLATRRSLTERTVDDALGELLPSAELPHLLAESDFVVLAVPLTEETRQLIGEAELRTMKPTAVLINIARGAVVDQGALVQALKDGVIAGAGLDVFEQEPLAEDSELWQMENVIMSPHISGGTEIYNQRAVGIFCDNLRRYLAGEPLMNLADPERGY
ncbi:MAG: D-2-hydroxyacid dehydrogenase [Chloroflexi bacterium]|nr:D-2-hydroxyacid dehydrogenase [Chloroflexota bacterium]